MRFSSGLRRFLLLAATFGGTSLGGSLFGVAFPGVPFFGIPSAQAADCNQTYSSSQILKDLEVLQISLRNLDEASFSVAAVRMEAGIPCLGSPVPTPVFSSAYRYIGVYFFYQNDEASARRWFRSSLELNPTFEWDAAEIEGGSPIRTIFEEVRGEATVDVDPIPGKKIAEPSGSSFTIDGKPLTEAAATPERYHVIQQIGKDRSVRTSWLVYGNDFPSQVMVDDLPEAVGTTPVAETPVLTTDDGKIKIERLRPPEKTPLLIGGIVGVAGAGALYAVALSTSGQLDPQSPTFPGTTAGLQEVQSRVNMLVLASGGLLVLGAGAGAWGFVLDGGAGAGFVLDF